jgi:hypothetical protein
LVLFLNIILFYCNKREKNFISRYSQLSYAKDKGRATATVYLIAFTIVGCIASAFLGSRHRKQGIANYEDELIKKHSEYSKAHQELIKSSHKTT